MRRVIYLISVIIMVSLFFFFSHIHFSGDKSSDKGVTIHITHYNLASDDDSPPPKIITQDAI